MSQNVAIRSAVSAALLLGTAGAAYPWAAWVKSGVRNGHSRGYYYAPDYTSIFSFNPANGGGILPMAGVTGVSGVLLGTTSAPARAFLLTPPSSGSTWSQTIIAGLNPGSSATLTPVNATQIVGTEPGDAFILTNTAVGVTKQTIYSFPAGSTPNSGLTVGPSGELYGTASGGASGAGFVYRLHLLPNQTWRYEAVYTFPGGVGGTTPVGGVVFSTVGANIMYGTTAYGGNAACTYTAGQSGCGVIYSMKAAPYGTQSTENVLHSFAGGADGAGPGGLIADGRYIYGAASAGGNGQGTVYSLTIAATYVYSTIYTFANTADGHTPNPFLAVDSTGDVYGTAQGGASGQGTVFSLVPSAIIKKGIPVSWSFELLHSFAGSVGTPNASADGAQPSGALAIDATGAVYGTTTYGGAYGYGSAFKLVP